ncbi:hypothetical protein [Tenacibaculum sp. IB213877]|jgi:hypothetical protein|uniref:hypothetical protein n=1 Tax=Tenacibaculum sp. IB213877 TaxID=3097351 RepID=UPI002A59FDDE|nr:hypothetical protein [Tenacibaculum sp. IB213877]MDY0779984.1 hypothetical protein [Tenacibaculum sp. IB213877]
MKNYVKTITGFCMLLSISLFATSPDVTTNFSSNWVANQEQITTAVYQGYSEEEGYKFLTDAGNEIAFHSATDEVLKEFELQTDSLEGKKFTIKYTSTKQNDGALIFTIVELIIEKT